MYIKTVTGVASCFIIWNKAVEFQSVELLHCHALMYHPLILC